MVDEIKGLGVRRISQGLGDSGLVYCYLVGGFLGVVVGGILGLGRGQEFYSGGQIVIEVS